MGRPKSSGRPFEIVVQAPPLAAHEIRTEAAVEPFAEAGATWWIEADWTDVTIEALRRTIEAGPPR